VAITVGTRGPDKSKLLHAYAHRRDLLFDHDPRRNYIEEFSLELACSSAEASSCAALATKQT
jgi:hypothetical protein